MNWLAHLLLAQPLPEARLGALLPDLVAPALWPRLSRAGLREIERHRAIDAFTDGHPIVRQSMRRFEPGYRRYAGIIVDLAYDHFLARSWPRYAPMPLKNFAASVYTDLTSLDLALPAEIGKRLRLMREEDWLCSYAELSGLRLTLSRVGSRFRRPIDLGTSVEIVLKQDAALQSDFEQFFPELMAATAPELSLVQ